MTTPLFPSVIGHNLLDGGTDAQDNNAYPGPFLQDWAAAVSVAGANESNAVALLGDSHMGDQTSIVGTTYNYNDYGPFHWANAKAGGRARLVLNAGVSGEDSAQILLRVSAIVAARPAVVFVSAGRNDINNGVAASVTKANLSAIWNALLASGAIVRACTIPPLFTGHPSLSAANTAKENDINDFIRRACQTSRRLKLCDFAKDIINKTSLTGLAVSGYLRDNVHVSATGGRVTGEASWYDALIEDIPAANQLPIGYTDSVGVTAGNSNVGNNPLFLGTGGTSTPATGTITATSIATDWNVEIRGGAATAVTATTPSRSDGFGNDQQVVCTFAGAADNVLIKNAASVHTRVTAGQTIKAIASLSMSSATNVGGIDFYIAIVVAGVTYFVRGLNRTSTTYSNTEFLDYVFSTEEWVIPAGAVTSLEIIARIYSSASGGATFRMGRAVIRVL